MIDLLKIIFDTSLIITFDTSLIITFDTSLKGRLVIKCPVLLFT
jgi:hypothetical protein